MAQTFHRVIPVLRVNDVDASLAYYVGVLGFTMDWRGDDGNVMASVSRGGCNLFLASGDQGHPVSLMWIGVSDVDALHDELLARDARVRHPPTNYPWGSRELHVEDPDGNVLRFGSENKAGEPMGDWLDMHGVRWRPVSTGGWTRVESR